MSEISSLQLNNMLGCCFIGDIHGNFNTIAVTLVDKYKLHDYVCILCGDCGFGFFEPFHSIFSETHEILAEKNLHFVFVRGNHDNPLYFLGKGKTPKDIRTVTEGYSNFHLMPDYSVVTVNEGTDDLNILLVGGAVSIDRTLRIGWMKNAVERECWWEDEICVLDGPKISAINKQFPNKISVVATHTAPDFAFPHDKKFISNFTYKDRNLAKDIERERKIMTRIFDRISKKQPLKYWFYGHFHTSNQMNVNGVEFVLLNIMTIYDYRLQTLPVETFE
jgi:DNA repair exonuclease SbcCD nuclease subunit